MRPHPLLLFLIEALLVVCWSSGFVGVRFASGYAPIFQILLWRSLVSGLVLLPVAVAQPRPPWRAMAREALFGALAMAGYLAGFALAIADGVPTGLVALIADMLPLAVAFLSGPVLGSPLSARQWLGAAISIAGVLVISGETLHLGNAPAHAYLLPVGGMLALALATVLQKRTADAPMTMVQRLCIQCLAAAAIFAVLAAGQGGVVPTASAGFALGIAWLVVFATFGGYGLYYLGLKWSTAARVSSVLYLSPPLTMAWAWLMFGEPFSLLALAGMLVTLGGLFLSSTAPDSRAAAAPAPIAPADDSYREISA